MAQVVGTNKGNSNPAVLGTNDDLGGEGIRGVSNLGHGVHGINGGDSGLEPQYGTGIRGESIGGWGVFGSSKTQDGVHGMTAGSGASAVGGVASNGGYGVFGVSDTGEGVHGASSSSHRPAIYAIQSYTAAGGQGSGVEGESHWHGVHGKCHSNLAAGVCGENDGGGLAGLFKGSISVSGEIILANADCAEDFSVVDFGSAEPGTVMVITESGTLTPCEQAYDKRVAGVVSGAGNYKPAMVLDHDEKLDNRRPLALLGKVFCKVDATSSPIKVGDLLTTSDTPGHAMKAQNHAQAFGSVIGKALRPLAEGRGILPILIALQ
jgi:hypothetical protein